MCEGVYIYVLEYPLKCKFWKQQVEKKSKYTLVCNWIKIMEYP